MSEQKTNSVLDAMLNQYEKATSFSSDNAFDPKNYFSTYLEDGIDSKMTAIRILPVDGSPFQEVHLHSAKVDGKNRKFACINHLKDEACPFCEARERLMATGEKSDEEIAKAYKTRLYYIVKVIDRENEADGPKFWRFPINYKKDGVMDKIMATIRLIHEDITDPETGRDLVLNIVRVKNPRGGTYPAINSVQARDKKPLSADAELVEKWLSDTKSWEDVYSVKDYEYLKLIVRGEIPAWSKKLEKFVAKSTLTDEDEAEETSEESLDSKVSMGANAKVKKGASNNTPVETEEEDVETEEETTYEAPVDTDDDDDDDDLPF